MAEVSASSPARKKNTHKNLSDRERMYLDTLPDSSFKRTSIGFFLYHGASVLVTQNVAIQYHIQRLLLPRSASLPTQRPGGMHLRASNKRPSHNASAKPTCRAP